MEKRQRDLIYAVKSEHRGVVVLLDYIEYDASEVRLEGKLGGDPAEVMEEAI